MSTTETSVNKRRSRILAIQKKNLVALIENYFIRTVGHASRVNFDGINIANWQRIATILNTLGPSKTAEQWKSSFYYMTNRIRKKVDIVRQCGARPSDNLSEIDLKIFEMSPMVDCALDFVFENTDSDEHCKNSLNIPHESTGTNQEDVNNDGEFELENITNGVRADDREGHVGEEAELEEVTFGASGRVLIALTSKELEAYMRQEVVQEVEENVSQQLRKGANDEVQDYSAECGTTVILSSPIPSAPSFRTNKRDIEREDRYRKGLSIEPSTEPVEQIADMIANFSEVCDEEYVSVPVNPLNPRIAEVRDQLSIDQRSMSQKMAPNSSKSKKPEKPVAEVKTSVRIPEIQKERLVQLIQNNFLKAVGQFVGSNGKFIKAQLWSKIAQELNTLGPPRTAAQWKTTFNNIKASAKSKLANYHNNVDGAMTQPLTRLEEKIVSIYGMDCMDGQQRLGEAGFQYDTTIPEARQRTISINLDEGDDVPINLENDDDEAINRYDGDDEAINRDNDEEILSNGSDVNNFPASSDMITEDFEERILAEIIQEIRNETDNNSTEPMRNQLGGAAKDLIDPLRATSNIPGVTKKRSHDEMNGIDRSTGRSPSTSQVNPDPEIVQSTPFSTRPSAPLQSRSLAPPRARPSVSSQSRSLAPPRARPSVSSQSRSLAPPRARPSVSSQARPSVSSQARPSVSSQARPSVSSQARPSVSSRARPLAPPRARPLAPPRARPSARASSSIEYVSSINQFFNDGSDSDDSSFEQSSSTVRSIQNGDQNTDQSGKPKRDRTDLSNRTTSFGMVQASIGAQERFIADANRNHSEMMFLNDRNHLEIVGMFNSTLSGLTNVVRELVNKM